MLGSGNSVAAKMKQVGDRAADCNEAVAMPGRFETHHPTLSSSRCEMRILGAIVQALVRTMLDAPD